MRSISLIPIILLVFFNTSVSAQEIRGTFTDKNDGYVYRWVRIGDQIWMAENLKATHYQNGDPLSDGTGKALSSEGIPPKYWFAYEDNLNNVADYGRLYTWHVVGDERNICPEGWHVPSDNEWKELETYLGMLKADADNTGWRGTGVAGKLKEEGISHWITPNMEADNSSGFTALPAGARLSGNRYNFFARYGYWWTSTEYDNTTAWGRGLGSGKSEVFRDNGHKNLGFSVQCIWDHGTDDPLHVLSQEEEGNEAFAEGYSNILAHYMGHESPILSVCYSPDGNYALSGSMDSTVRLWDIEEKRVLKTFSDHDGAVWSVGFSPDGGLALSASSDQTIKLWDISSGSLRNSFHGHSDGVSSTCFSPDGKSILSGSFDKSIILWDMESGEEIRRFNGHEAEVYSVCFSSDGKYILSGSEDKTAKLWDAGTGNAIVTFRGGHNAVSSVCLSSDGKTALTGNLDKSVRLWDTGSGKEIKRFVGHHDYVMSVAISPDGNFALSGSMDRTVKMWDVNAGSEMMSFEGHALGVYSVCFSPDGMNFLSGSEDLTMKLWIPIFYKLDFQAEKLPTATEAAQKPKAEEPAESEIRIFEEDDYVNCVCFSPDGKYFLAGYDNAFFNLCDVTSGEVIRRFDIDPGSEVESINISPDGKYVISGNNKSPITYMVWDLSSGRELGSYTNREYSGDAVSCFSTDSKSALLRDRDYLIQFDLIKGKKIKKMPNKMFGEDGTFEFVSYMQDGRFALTGYDPVLLWDIKKGKVIKRYEEEGYPGSYNDSRALSPDRKLILLGNSDDNIYLLDLESGNEIKRFTGLDREPETLVFSPDGRCFLSIDFFGSAQLWEISTEKVIKTFEEKLSKSSTCFSPDGNYILSGTGKQIKIIDISSYID